MYISIEEALKWTDDFVFTKTGQHLDSLQRAILEGTWQNQAYKEIADEYHCSTDHVRKTASDLWKFLSDVLGEEVKKSNVRSILKRVEFKNISSFGAELQILSHINICSEICPYPEILKKRSPSSTPDIKPEKRHDLTYAPECDRLYNRTEELATLKQWILQENSRIITIFGLSGIGKTALTRQLVEQIKDNFDRLIWRSHTKFPTLNTCKNFAIFEETCFNRKSDQQRSIPLYSSTCY